MELYTNSHPMLVSEHVTNFLNKIIEDVKIQNTSIFQKIYDNIFYPNMGIFIVISIIIAFLCYRYYTVKKSKKNNEQFNEQQYGNEPEQYNRNVRTFGGMDDPNEIIARPTFNPSKSVTKQQSYVRYLPDEIPVNMNGVLIDAMTSSWQQDKHKMFVDNVNLQDRQYTAPMNDLRTNNYTGPFYKAAENGLSDDMYKGFSEANQQNLMDYDNLLQQKIYIE